MDYKFLLECKNDLFNFLSSMLINSIYLGIRGMYEYSVKMHNTLEEKCKLNNKLVNPGISSIFKLCLSDIMSLNNYEIENIYNDIKQQSGCYNYFDDLVKACFKSYILLLTYNPVTENSKFSSPELYEGIVVKNFIHKCYIEVSNYFKDNIELITKDRKREIHNIIKECIEHSIKKSISNYDEIIKEYLKINFDISKKEDKMNYDNIKSMVSKMIDTQKYGHNLNARGGGNIIIENGKISDDLNEGTKDSSFNNVENFINANKELDDIIKNNYNDGADSAKQLSGNNYILNTQSNENSTTMQLQEGTSNIINVGLNKDKEIDNILNNKLEPINEEEEKLELQPIKIEEPIIQQSIGGGIDISATSTDIVSALDITSVNENILTEVVDANKTSLLESPLPIKSNKINDIISTVKKGRPPKNRNADKFFNNLV